MNFFGGSSLVLSVRSHCCSVMFFPAFLLAGLMAGCGISKVCAAEPPARRVMADFQTVKGTNSHFEAVCVGAGRAAELLRKAAVDQLKDVHDNCGFKFLRFHGLFQDDMAVYSEDKGKPAYNFQYVDLAY